MAGPRVGRIGSHSRSSSAPGDSRDRYLTCRCLTCRGSGRGPGEGPPSPGVLAIRIARGAVVPARRDARRSRANVRHPATAQARTASPFALDGLPGTTPCRPRSVAGWGRAFGACCFAGKLRSPAHASGDAATGTTSGRRPLRHSPRQPLRHSLRVGGAYPWLRWPSASALVSPLRGASRPQKPRPTGPPRGSGASARQGALRAIDPFRRSRSWRTCGPHRLRRQSQPRLVATQGDAVGARSRSVAIRRSSCSRFAEGSAEG
jgi:hypothetical protein